MKLTYPFIIHLLTFITYIYTYLTYKNIIFKNNVILDGQYERVKIYFLIAVGAYTFFSGLNYFFDSDFLHYGKIAIVGLACIILTPSILIVPISIQSMWLLFLIANYYFQFKLS